MACRTQYYYNINISYIDNNKNSLIERLLLLLLRNTSDRRKRTEEKRGRDSNYVIITKCLRIKGHRADATRDWDVRDSSHRNRWTPAANEKTPLRSRHAARSRDSRIYIFVRDKSEWVSELMLFFFFFKSIFLKCI